MHNKSLGRCLSRNKVQLYSVYTIYLLNWLKSLQFKIVSMLNESLFLVNKGCVNGISSSAQINITGFFLFPPKHDKHFRKPALGVISRISVARPCLPLMPTLYDTCKEELSNTAFSDFSFTSTAPWMSSGGGEVIENALLFLFVILPWSEGTLLGGFVIFKTAILNSLLYDSAASFWSHPIMDDIYLQRIFVVARQKKCWADSFPFHLIIRLAGPCCC